MSTTQQKPTYADAVNKPVKNPTAEKEVTPKPQISQIGTKRIKRKASDISPEKEQNQNKDTYFGIPIQNRFSAFNRMDTTVEADSISDKPPTLEIDADWNTFNSEINKTVAAAETVSSVPPPSPKPHPVLHPHPPQISPLLIRGNPPNPKIDIPWIIKIGLDLDLDLNQTIQTTELNPLDPLDH